MRRDPRAFVWDALDALRAIETFVGGMSADR
jgi:hypothetical protein